MTGAPANKTCPLCGGDLREGIATIPFLIGKSVAVVKDVPAEICADCGEPFLTGRVTDAVTALLKEIQDLKVEVSVIEYRERRRSA